MAGRGRAAEVLVPGVEQTSDRKPADSLTGLTVKDLPADDWSLYQVSGRKPNELLVRPTVANPLTGASALRRRDARRRRGRQRPRGDRAPRRRRRAGRAGGAAPATPPSGDVVETGTRRNRYVPSTAVPHLWHPYVTSDAGNVRFVQARLADLNLRPVVPRPGPTSRLLRDPAAGPVDPTHQISPGGVPRNGLRIDRRHVLGRRVDGQPLLWVQRRGTPPLSPPASSLPFDILEEIVELSL